MSDGAVLQGPFADAMTHAGQLAMLRRLAGSPIPPENFIVADISPDTWGRINRRRRVPTRSGPSDRDERFLEGLSALCRLLAGVLYQLHPAVLGAPILGLIGRGRD